MLFCQRIALYGALPPGPLSTSGGGGELQKRTITTRITTTTQLNGSMLMPKM